MAHDRDNCDRGSHHRQMGRFPSAMPEKRQDLHGHCRGFPCCVPCGQVWSSKIAELLPEAGSGGNGAGSITEGRGTGKVQRTDVLSRSLVVAIIVPLPCESR